MASDDPGRGTWRGLRTGEKLMFGFTLLLTFAAIGRGVAQLERREPSQPRNYYEWTDQALAGQSLYRRLGCNSCHRALGSGEVGIAPVLDGEGTRRSLEWLEAYMADPTSKVPGSAHDGRLGPALGELEPNQQGLLAAFMFAMKANPGSPSHPDPPPQLRRRVVME